MTARYVRSRPDPEREGWIKVLLHRDGKSTDYEMRTSSEVLRNGSRAPLSAFAAGERVRALVDPELGRLAEVYDELSYAAFGRQDLVYGRLLAAASADDTLSVLIPRPSYEQGSKANLKAPKRNRWWIAGKRVPFDEGTPALLAGRELCFVLSGSRRVQAVFDDASWVEYALFVIDRE